MLASEAPELPMKASNDLYKWTQARGEVEGAALHFFLFFCCVDTGANFRKKFSLFDPKRLNPKLLPPRISQTFCSSGALCRRASKGYDGRDLSFVSGPAWWNKQPRRRNEWKSLTHCCVISIFSRGFVLLGHRCVCVHVGGEQGEWGGGDLHSSDFFPKDTVWRGIDNAVETMFCHSSAEFLLKIPAGF